MAPRVKLSTTPLSVTMKAMQPVRVFISSVMNRAIEDLTAERQAALAAVEHFSPVTQAWAFEAEPASTKPLLASYLDEVRACDLFLLILGNCLTIPVNAELQLARDYGKPVLLFNKEIPSRASEAEQLLRTFDGKYDCFKTEVELQEKVRRALGNYLLSLTGRDAVAGNHIGDRLARLRALSKGRRLVRILPTVPFCIYNSFMVEEVSHRTVRFQKDGLANVYVPAERIEAVLEAGEHQPPTVSVNGRLQWITVRRNWYFFPERPPAGDPLGVGIGREVPRQPMLSEETQSWLKAYPLSFVWSNRHNVAGREVFFDLDGCHFTNAGQILTCVPVFR